MSHPISTRREPWQCWKVWVAVVGVALCLQIMLWIAVPPETSPLGRHDPKTGTYLTWARQGHGGGRLDLKALAASSGGDSQGGGGSMYYQLAALPEVVENGEAQYNMFCLSCHGGPATTGDAPSNLFDPVWHYGDGPDGVAHIIRKGYPDGGMPAWEAMIEPDVIDAIVAYLFSHQEKPAS
ncbi:MAG: cytochrome c [Verrucomicrobiota bacterium JB022]|nr:cytochrome c [Verrucomicrobiota bacterium JB022]